jgi:hypothetical protein
MGTLDEDVFTFMKISLWILLRMRNISNKICRENQNTHFKLSNFPPPPPPRRSCRLWDNVENVVEQERQKIIWRTRFSCWIGKATRAQAESRSAAPTRTHTDRQTEICNTYCFSTTTAVSWTHLVVTLCVLFFFLRARIQARESCFTNQNSVKTTAVSWLQEIWKLICCW